MRANNGNNAPESGKPRGYLRTDKSAKPTKREIDARMTFRSIEQSESRLLVSIVDFFCDCGSGEILNLYSHQSTCPYRCLMVWHNNRDLLRGAENIDNQKRLLRLLASDQSSARMQHITGALHPDLVRAVFYRP